MDGPTFVFRNAAIYQESECDQNDFPRSANRLLTRVFS